MINFFKKISLEIVVFVSGAVVMIFELVGSRIVGPYIGTSTYVWTSLIGVILASLSLGYYLGGKLADKKPETKPLAFLLMLSALFIAFSALFKDLVPLTIGNFVLSLDFQSILVSLILFAPASVFLGMVSPYAVRLRVNMVENMGKTAGNLYALSTLGSIVGTFLAGFYIIPRFGSGSSLFILVAILFFLAVFILGKDVLKKFHLIFLFVVIFLILASFFGREVFRTATFLDGVFLIDKDTEYNRIWVYKSIDQKTKKSTINLSTDPFGTQAAIFADGDNELVFDYTKFYRISEFFNPEIKTALTLGGCIYSQPRDFLKRNPNSTIDVVEIDPGMTEIAKKYFGFKDDPRLSVIHQDGRIFLNRNEKKYDAIFIDAFNSASSVPFHLTTKEVAKLVFNSLNDNGIVMMNLISSIEGQKGKFMQAEYATYKEVFPQVYIFPVRLAENVKEIQNIMLVALKNPKTLPFVTKDKEISKQLANLWKNPIEKDVPILTDDYAPVEFYKRLSI